MVHQTRGGIYVGTDTGDYYRDTQQNFAGDFGGAISALPEGITERIYEPDRKHTLIKDHDVVGGGPMPWPEGDKILAAFSKFAMTKKEREEAYVKSRIAAVEQEVERNKREAAERVSPEAMVKAMKSAPMDKVGG